jgi:urea transporter
MEPLTKTMIFVLVGVPVILLGYGFKRLSNARASAKLAPSEEDELFI